MKTDTAASGIINWVCDYMVKINQHCRNQNQINSDTVFTKKYYFDDCRKNKVNGDMENGSNPDLLNFN